MNSCKAIEIASTGDRVSDLGVKKMIKEHDRVVLRKPIPEQGLKMGDVGTVVHVHGKAEAFEVEFLTLHGERSVSPLSLLHRFGRS
jgi:uncharacterized protein DUF4926